jgi:hypothetical protein
MAQDLLMQHRVPNNAPFADLALSDFKLRFHKSNDKGLLFQEP